MKRKSLEQVSCPVAQSLERVGDQWSMLIMRDALNGCRRFDEFQKSLEIAPNILTRRLKALVHTGFLERQQYSRLPPRNEYVLTERGRDFQSVVHALLAFGNRHYANDGRAVVMVDTETGMEAEPVVIDSVSGLRLDHPRFRSSAELKRQADALLPDP